MSLESEIPSSWSEILRKEFSKDYFTRLSENVTDFYGEEKNRVFPKKEHVFRAFDLCSFEDVKVVILGQDPYPTAGNANGLCFSVSSSVKKIPKSLNNIFLELQSDLGIPFPIDGNLEPWAKQGVFLLNSILTVEEGKPNCHSGIGWEQFTDSVIQSLSEKKSNLVFLLWGTKAIAKKTMIDCNKHLVLTAPHPSPLSSYRGFFGCKHFSKTNAYFQNFDIPKINW
jgi:uracil-DNA glycosylase